MKKNIYMIIIIFSFAALLANIPGLIDGIKARGFGGVNYGGVGFPLLIGIAALLLRKRKA